MKKKQDVYIGLAASLLSFSLSILSFSNLNLTLWWHYLIAVFAIGLAFILYFFLIQFTIRFMTVIKRASIKSDINDELNQLVVLINNLYEKHCIYEKAISEYKKVQLFEINELIKMISAKIIFIENYCLNKITKDKPVIQNEELFIACKEFYNNIIKKY